MIITYGFSIFVALAGAFVYASFRDHEKLKYEKEQEL